ncbi:hypothetical protein ONS95_005722 [Cadophora gregata]|uniref:uncharacterized protein n=1 Tax=Cadophora gregata TaxID=51156 RepID=UPI0026DB6828|nr:uncharacterized protein ONS95_005722 [Cadophora gregata]KAK0103715.1 hypothetical protein ONS95_005722 [Cadophora gregata]
MVVDYHSNHFSDPINDTMASSPTYSYSDHSTPPLPPYAPQYPTTTSTSTSTTYPPPQSHPSSSPSSSPLPSLTSPFPLPLPAPPNLQIRLLPHLPTLQTLDAALTQKSDLEGGLPPLLDENRMVGKGRIEVEDGEEELSAREARAVLDEGVRNRMGFVGLASGRLQAVVGERNCLDFELPDVPLNHSPFLHRLTNNTSNQNSNLSPAIPSQNQSKTIGGGFDRRKDSGVSLPFRSPLSPISPWGFGQVDEKTGKGLREWLLSRGKETGTQRKRECRTISFHDFTPDMRTGEHANDLVAHYNGGGLHERADVYEVDLPTTYNNPTTGLPTQGTQTWIWFLISRPILTLSPTETNTDPDLSGHYEKWAKLGIWTPKPLSVVRPPPDFPMPVPTSYVVFACPASNVTAYPDCKDDHAPPDPPATSYIRTLAPSYRTSQLNSRSRPRDPSPSEPDTTPSPPKRIYKRKDYDFSFQGTPLFEFFSLSSPHFTVPSPNPTTPHSLTTTINDPNDHAFAILSIDNIGSWYATDASGPCTLAEYQTRVQDWEAEIENLSREERKDDDRKYRDRSTEVPHARVGKWWDVFYEGVYKEESRWRRIRESMSRGKCRIVIRWVDAEGEGSPNGNGYGQVARKKLKMSPNLGGSGDEGDGSGDSDFGDGGGIGLGLSFNTGAGHGQSQNGSGKADGNNNGGTTTRADSKKIKERLSGRRTSGGAGQSRATRSGARRKSGLGVVTSSQEELNGAMVGGNAIDGFSGVLIGIGRGNGEGVTGLEGMSLIETLKAGDGGRDVVKDKRRQKSAD